MKYLRLTFVWSMIASAVTFGASSVNVEETMGYTVERVLSDKLVGLPATVSDRPAYTKKLAKHFYRLCTQNDLDPALVLSLIQVESGFRADVVSPAGAIGLMQIMPGTAHHVARRDSPEQKRIKHDLKDPFLNLRLGMIYLRELKDRYAGESPYYHLAAYNMGPSRLDSLRAKPGFSEKPSMKYVQDVMRGVSDWRHYGFQSLTIELKSKADVARKTIARNIDPA